MEHAAPTVAQLLFELFVLVLAVQFMGWLFRRFGQPAVIGELVAGVIIGPSILGLVHEGHTLEFIAEVGAIFLLFMVGLETRLKDVLAVGKEAFLVAFVGVILPFILGYYFSVLSGHNTVASLFFGAALVATSVGITARVLQELGVLSRPYSRIILGAAVIDDILGLIVLAIVSGIAQTGTVEAGVVIRLIVVSAIFVGLAMAAVPLVRRVPFDRIPFQSPYGTAVVFALGMAALAKGIGLAPIVGAFLAGMIMAEVAEEQGLGEPVHALEGFLAPIFFAYMGILLDLKALGSSEVIVAGLIVGLIAILGKLVTFVPALTQGLKNAIVVGVGMIPRGEVGLIVAAIGLSNKAIDEAQFAVVIFMVVLTTLLAPLLLKPLILWAEGGRLPTEEA